MDTRWLSGVAAFLLCAGVAWGGGGPDAEPAEGPKAAPAAAEPEPGALPAPAPAAPEALPEASPAEPGALPGAVPAVPEALPEASPAEPGALPGAVPAVPEALPEASPAEPGALPEAVPAVPESAAPEASGVPESEPDVPEARPEPAPEVVPEPAPGPSLRVCVAEDAPPALQAAAARILEAGTRQPLLRIMTGATPPTREDSRGLAGTFGAAGLARTHLVAIGLPDDPLVKALWQNEAEPGRRSLHVYGQGTFRGDIGYVESGGNPFLAGLTDGPDTETQAIVLTGTTVNGVLLAVDAFLEKGLINGVVAGRGWRRLGGGLECGMPLPPDFAVPCCVPERIGNAERIGLIQGGQDDRLRVLEAAHILPVRAWRCKYYAPGNWKASSNADAPDFRAGLHRRADGWIVWAAEFRTPAHAEAAAKALAGTEARWLGSDEVAVEFTVSGSCLFAGNVPGLFQAVPIAPVMVDPLP